MSPPVIEHTDFGMNVVAISPELSHSLALGTLGGTDCLRRSSWDDPEASEVPDLRENAPGVPPMIVEDQSATEAFLGEQARSGSARPGEVVATHISRVFLSDHFAYKLKRAVRFPYLYFSTATARLAAVLAGEFALNRSWTKNVLRSHQQDDRTH